MRILLFEDHNFKPFANFNADDVRDALKETSGKIAPVDLLGLEKLDRSEADLLILPYVRGNFTETALSKMIQFHSSGGSLLFLGDLPNHNAWFPYRNMESWRFHLTRGSDHYDFSGLTSFGQSVLGDLPGLDKLRGREIKSLRVTAFPPDITYPMFTIKSYDHSTESRAVICVERKHPRFLGSRLAVVGFNGGEPRENVQGVYNLPWEHDPGLLDRNWVGAAPLIRGLVNWLKPVKIAGAIDSDPVQLSSAAFSITVRLTNPSGAPVTLEKVRIIEKDSGSVIKIPELDGVLAETKTLNLTLSQKSFGIYNYRLLANADGVEVILAESKKYMLSEDVSEKPGYGAATYWAFQKGKVPEEYFTFIKELRRRGCQYVRANLPWEDIEPEQGRFDWTIPDALANFALEQGMRFSFWMFPVTRGSALGDGGVPEWTLKEPAIDRDGNPGNHPTLWGDCYQKHFFEMVNQLTSRYANHPGIWRFILDFGNSDFPYGYYYYVNDKDLFDYSPFEQKAFAKYLIEQRKFSMEQIAVIYGRSFSSPEEIPVPRTGKDPGSAWMVYLDFRGWTVRKGIEKAFQICRTNAPAKTPPDLPGHGAGSMADISSYNLEASKEYWDEQSKYDPRLVALHNAGPEWGGEAWQVGCDYRQSDEAVFNSLRLNADYYTIAGSDMGSYGDVFERTGFIRRTIMGAKRLTPEIAVIDHTSWNSWTSMANVLARLDQGTAILCSRNRFDFSRYRLFVLPPDELHGDTTTMRTSSSLLPIDEEWYVLLAEAVKKGLNLLVFPDSCQPNRMPIPLTFLRQTMGLDDVRYGERTTATILWPDSFLGGSSSGKTRAVFAEGEVLIRTTSGDPALVRRPYGKGSILLAGYDGKADSPDGDHCYERDERIGNHSLNRLCLHLGIVPRNLDTSQLYIAKELVSRKDKDYLLLFSHLPHTIETPINVKLSRPSSNAYDLATGEKFDVTAKDEGWHSLTLPILTRKGRYLSFHD